jgi:hypothetical protein
MKRLAFVLFAALWTALPAGGAQAQSWGDLSATFVYDGEIPKETPLKITSDVEFCSKFHVIDESLVVNAENKGIPNVFAYLYISRTDEPAKPHPVYSQTASAAVTLDNNCCRFDPHVVLLRTSQTLIVANSDDIGHNCKIDTLVNPPINYTLPAKGKLEHRFLLAERLPVRVSCSIHPWMSAWLLIRDNPYMAVSDDNGKLVIKNLPVGTWSVQFWHEKAGYVSQVAQEGKKTEWKRGRLEIEIKPGANDLGAVTLAQTVFAE